MPSTGAGCGRNLSTDIAQTGWQGRGSCDASWGCVEGACHRAAAEEGPGQRGHSCGWAGLRPAPTVTGSWRRGRAPAGFLSAPTRTPHRDTCQGGRPVVWRSPPAGAGRGADTAANEKGSCPRGGGLRRAAGNERGREAACLDAAAASGRDEYRFPTCSLSAWMVWGLRERGRGADAAAGDYGARASEGDGL